MLKIFIGQAFAPQEVLVSPDQTLKQIYEEAHISTKGTVSWNTRVLGARELDTPISVLGINDQDMVTVTDKLNGGR